MNSLNNSNQLKSSKRIENKKLKILENLTVDINNKHIQLINSSSSYTQKLLFNDLQNLLENIDTNKCSYSTIFVKLERKILDKINLMNKNAEFNTTGKNDTKNLNTVNKNNLSQSQSQNNMLNLNLNKQNDPNSQTNLHNSNSNLPKCESSDIIYQPRVKILDEIKKKQEDEWVKITKMKYQEYLEEQEKQKTKKLEEKNTIRENLLNQIQKKEEKKKKILEEDNKFVDIIKQNVANFYESEAEKVKSSKQNYLELENFRHLFMQGILLVLIVLLILIDFF